MISKKSMTTHTILCLCISYRNYKVIRTQSVTLMLLLVTSTKLNMKPFERPVVRELFYGNLELEAGLLNEVEPASNSHFDMDIPIQGT